MTHAIELLTRGHKLYGDEPRTADPARRPQTLARPGDRAATRTVLDGAHGDTVPAPDTPFGPREALRGGTARIQTQRRTVCRSRRHSRLLASEPAATLGAVQVDGHRLGYARGISQTLAATFAVANICASMNCVMHCCGVSAEGANPVAFVQQADAGRAPKGY